jgi:hypothetical protein
MTNWTRDHQTLLGRIFDGCVALGIAVDLVLVLALRVTSISQRIWIATEAHSTLMPAGALTTVFVCWLVRGSWRRVFFGGVLGGHLFTHL